MSWDVPRRRRRRSARPPAACTEPSGGLPRRWRRSWLIAMPSLAETYAGAGALDRAIEQYQRALELGHGSTISAIGWRGS